MKASRFLLVMVAVMAMVIVPAIGAEESEAEPTVITKDMSVSASGTFTGGTWIYSRSSSTSDLYISGGSIPTISSWTISAMSINGEPVSDLSQYKVSDILKSTVVLTVSNSGSVSSASYTIRSLNPTSATFSTGVTTVAAGFFEGCISLSSVDIGTASVDPLTFKGCTGLKKITVSDKSTHYFSGSQAGGRLYSIDGKTLIVNPQGLCSSSTLTKVSDLLSSVERINLGFSSAIYYADNIDGKEIVFNPLTGCSERGLNFSTLGMKSCDISRNGSYIIVKYTLYKGWVLDECKTTDGLTVRVDSNQLTMTLPTSGDKMAWTVYPMGVDVLTYESLRSVTSLDGWDVTITNVQSDKTGVVTDVDPLKVVVTGYSGSSETAELSGTMDYNGIICKVEGVQAKPGAMSGLKELTVGEGIAIGDHAFANTGSLVKIKADHVDKIGVGAFRYCTALEEASFKSCVRFDDYAFDACRFLDVLDLGNKDVSFGKDALRGCKDLGVVTAGMDSDVSGLKGVPVIHYDHSYSEIPVFEVMGGQVLITWTGMSSIEYADKASMEGAEKVYMYYHSMVVIPLDGDLYVKPHYGASQGAKCLVVFDSGFDSDAMSSVVTYGQKVDYRDPNHKWGYKFLGWMNGLEEFDFDEPVTDSMVLTAKWMKEDGVDSTPIYLGVIFVISAAISAVIIGIARREQKWE